jgi:hypothetical protein
MIFGSVDNVYFGHQRLLRLLYKNERELAIRGPAEDREQHFEQANKWAQMMSEMDLIWAVGRGGR